MTQNAHIKAPKVIFWSLLGLFALAHWAIFAIFPRISDDYWYGLLQHDYLQGLSDAVSWGGVWETLRLHFTYDNMRLANVVFVFLQLLPQWLSAIIPAAVILWLCREICRFAGIDGRSPFLVTLTLLCLSLFPPWFENFFSLCFALNYLPPAAMMCVYTTDITTTRQLSGWAYANALILGFWHEAFAISLLVGSAVYLLTARPRRQSLKLAACLLPGTLFLCVTAILATLRNCGFVVGDVDLLHNIVSVGKLQVPLVLYIICVIYSAVSLRDWHKLFSPWVLLLLAIALTAISMNVVITRGERISTVAHIACIMGIIRCLADATRNRRSTRRSALSCIAAMSIIVLLAWHYAAVIHRSLQIRRVWPDFEARAAISPGPVFVDIPSPATDNLILWRKPDSMIFNVWNVWHFSDYISMGQADRSHRWIIPEALRTVTPTSGKPIPGNAGIRSVNGWLFMPDDADHAYLPIFTTRMGPFVKTQVCATYPFTASDGRRYIFIAPLNQYFPSFLFPISSMDFLYTAPYSTSVDYLPFAGEDGEDVHYL